MNPKIKGSKGPSYTERIRKDISDGKFTDDNPIDNSDGFIRLCHACRRGDLKECQEMISAGVNINARDNFDYTPLILASLCGHFEVVQLLLDSGAICERDTFQGERCLYNALNNRIRNLLLKHDYSKSTNPLQPYAAHLFSILSKENPKTSDVTLATSGGSFPLHKFVLAARSPYFERKFKEAPSQNVWDIPNCTHRISLQSIIRYLYLGADDVEHFRTDSSNSFEREINLETEGLNNLFEISNSQASQVADSTNHHRQRGTGSLERGRDQLEAWFRENILKHKVYIESSKVNNYLWKQGNHVYADVFLRAMVEDEVAAAVDHNSSTQPANMSVLYPVHRAMLIRSEYFLTMFTSAFREAQQTPYLQVISMDCSPEVLEVILSYMYTERAIIPLELAIDVLFAADQLFMERLKTKAAIIISTLGNGNASNRQGKSEAAAALEPAEDSELINVYDIIRAGWLTNVHRLEEFGARYLADRLEKYIEEEEFADLICESANRIAERQETDTIELLDDIRYYLSERFRLRFEDVCLRDLIAKTEKRPNEAEEEAEAHGTPPSKTTNEDAALHAENKRTEEVRDRLDDNIAGDQIESQATNYQALLNKLDTVLEKLKLDA
ncbi:MAG: hypothetical protein M1829_000316 [Trizodia sp. TS-e1964]|nr:MAG: hypothetical protein M1829_000316 [Trizodia sp. TS-e1964]